jgi:hypothetical protein
MRRCGDALNVATPALIIVPSDGSGGRTPTPRNDSAASSTTAFVNSTVKIATSVNETFGSNSRAMTRDVPAPCRTAASTNGCERTAMTRARTGRATYGTETTPISSAVTIFDAARASCSASVVPTATPARSTGNDHTTSNPRMTTVSVRPRTKPASTPAAAPSTIETSAATAPMVSEVRAP